MVNILILSGLITVFAFLISKTIRKRNINETFQRTWKDAKTNPPKEGGRYWCLIEEQTDLGKSQFQWNCSYHEIENRWSDNNKNYNVIYWTELPLTPGMPCRW